MKKFTLAVAALAVSLSFAVVAPAANASPISRANAVRSAKSYLEFEAFSYRGLIGQLRYEGYTSYDAAYGAGHAGANWFRQAAKSARSYLQTMPFSRSGLIQQLEYEKFTPAQAIYGVNAVGL